MYKVQLSEPTVKANMDVVQSRLYRLRKNVSFFKKDYFLPNGMWEKTKLSSLARNSTLTFIIPSELLLTVTNKDPQFL